MFHGVFVSIHPQFLADFSRAVNKEVIFSVVKLGGNGKTLIE